MSSPRPLRIACLHGYRQNAQKFRHKIGALRKALQRDIHLLRPSPTISATRKIPLAELFYIDAPFVIESIIEEDQYPQKEQLSAPQSPASERVVFAPRIHVQNSTSREKSNHDNSNHDKDLTQRTWWQAEGRVYSGWQRSTDYLRAHFAEKQFDGILGFSQGAIITSLICALQTDKTSRLQEFSSLRFAIMLSGFPSRADDHKHLYNLIDFPSMHIWGAKDEIVKPVYSERLMNTFRHQDRHSLEHANGHIVPSDAHSRNAISDFVLRFAEPEAALDLTDQPRAAL